MSEHLLRARERKKEGEKVQLTLTETSYFFADAIIWENIACV